MPFPNKISCFVSTCVSSDSSFPSVRQEPRKRSPFLQQTHGLDPFRLLRSWAFLGKNTGVGNLSLLQGIFPTQELNPGLLNCRRILYQLNHKGSPRILEWICCRKRDPFQGPKLGSCLMLGNELCEETHLLTKQEILLGKGTWVESRRVRQPRRTALSHGLQSLVLW